MFGWPRSLFRDGPCKGVWRVAVCVCRKNLQPCIPTAHGYRLDPATTQADTQNASRVRYRTPDYLEKVLSGLLPPPSQTTSSKTRFRVAGTLPQPDNARKRSRLGEGRPPGHSRLLRPGCRYLRGSRGAPHPTAVIRRHRSRRPA